MNKYFKKAIGLISILAVTLTSTGLPRVYAEGKDWEDETIKFGTVEEYIEHNIQSHLYAHSVTIEGALKYSEPIALYNFDNNSIVGSEIFIFDGDLIIGKTAVYDTDNGYVSTFDTYISNDLYSVYQSGEKIAMGYTNNSLLMYSTNYGYVYVDGNKIYDLPHDTPQELNAITICGEASPEYEVPYSFASIKLDVTHIGRSETYNKKGECWASCLAMQLNYHNNLNLTADKVLENCIRNKIGSYNSENNYVVNIDQEIDAYNLYDYSVTRVDSITHSDVVFTLKDNKPLAISINNTNFPNNSGHKILIKGITLNSFSSTYIFDDPDREDEVSIKLDGHPGTPLNTNFSYSGFNNCRYIDY